MPTPPTDYPLAKDAFPELFQKPCMKDLVRDCGKHNPIRDRAAMTRCRARGKCEFPGCKNKTSEKFNRLDPHHLKPVSRGGDDSDVNLACICREHHKLVHSDPVCRDALIAAILRRMTP